MRRKASCGQGGLSRHGAELERSTIQERVKVGLERARAKGVTLGRPKASLKVKAKIRDLAATGLGKVKLARELGVGVSVVQRVLATRDCLERDRRLAFLQRPYTGRYIGPGMARVGQLQTLSATVQYSQRPPFALTFCEPRRRLAARSGAI
jgi:hypothetical protein